MDTYTRIGNYTNDSPRLTPRQRRRVVKKAGRDPLAITYRDDGMGYGLGKQGMREVVELLNPPQPGDEEPF
jgi:hypothetical protein